MITCYNSLATAYTKHKNILSLRIGKIDDFVQIRLMLHRIAGEKNAIKIGPVIK